MRVIGGEFRSRVLKSLPGSDVRPTPDRLREALFNVLMPRIKGAVFADVYAGTGAVGIEALSRGAARCIFVERSRGALGVLRQNLKSLGLETRAEVRCDKASVTIPKLDADIVFLDPPYPLEREYEITLNALGVLPKSLVLAQHDTHLALDEGYGTLRRVRVLRQGSNCVSFYEPAAS